jgi:hypothetical protein
MVTLQETPIQNYGTIKRSPVHLLNRHYIQLIVTHLIRFYCGFREERSFSFSLNFPAAGAGHATLSFLNRITGARGSSDSEVVV